MAMAVLAVSIIVTSLVFGQVAAQSTIFSWTCECSGITFNIPVALQESWFSSGQTHSNAAAVCAAEGGTMIAHDTDFQCLRQYTDYLYPHYNLNPTADPLWLATTPTNTTCYGYTGCEIVNEHTCFTTLRFLCQKRVPATPAVPLVPNTLTSSPSNPPNIQVTYSCQDGYEPSSEDAFVSHCAGARYWSVPSISCGAISCPEIIAPANGRLDLSKGFLFNSQGRFSCNSGYFLDGDTQLSCQPNSTWNGSIPACVPVDCGQPPSVPNSVLTVNTTMLGSTATYTCDAGYYDPRTSPVQVAICQETTAWNTSTIRCPIVDCGRPRVIPGTNMDYSTTTYESRIYYNCSDGYMQVNESDPYQAVCGAGGMWIENEINCTGVDCGTPPSLPNSDVAYSSTVYLSTAAYTCQPGYENSTFRHTAQCTASAVWDAWNIACDAVDCGLPPTYGNSRVNYTATTYLSTAHYYCTDGHEPPTETQPYETSCQVSGQWQSLEVACEATHCPELPVPANGYITFSNGTVYGSVTVFVCNPGYVVEGSEALQCQLDKTWNASMPQCSAGILCPNIPAPENGNVTRLLGNSNEVNTVLRFTCNYGYRLNGSSTLVCTVNGQWTDDMPFCEVDDMLPTTPAAPAAQKNLESTAILSITLGVVLLCIFVLVLGVGVYLKRRRRLFSITLDDNSRPRYSSDSHQLTTSSKHDGHGRRSTSSAGSQSNESAQLLR